MTIEICTDTLHGAIAAQKYGAKRIELCSALSVGGLTPSFGLIQACSELSGLEVHVMIRHKDGGFQYKEADVSIMKKDIAIAHQAGAHGVVFGILNDKKEISTQNEELIDLVKSLGMEVTFHRAFDRCADYKKAIMQLIDWDVDRLLTSGLAPIALNGLPIITDLQKMYGDKIQIMAGSGINAENALLIAASGIRNLHFTARKAVKAVDKFSMGAEMIVDEDKIKHITNLFQ